MKKKVTIILMVILAFFSLAPAGATQENKTIVIQAEDGEKVGRGMWWTEKRDEDICVVTATRGNFLTFSINIPADGTYQLWIRHEWGFAKGSYSVKLDDEWLGVFLQVDPEQREGKLLWSKVCTLGKLKEGKYVLRLECDEPKPVSFDILLVTFDPEFKPEGAIYEAKGRPQIMAPGKSIFSNEERLRMKEEGLFQYEVREINGMRVPYINGRGLIGALTLFTSTYPYEQDDYEAPILSQQGFNYIGTVTRWLGQLPDQGYIAYIRERAERWRKQGIGSNLTIQDHVKGVLTKDVKYNNEYIDIDGKSSTWVTLRLGANIFDPQSVEFMERYFNTHAEAFKDIPGMSYCAPQGEITIPGYGPRDQFSRKNWQEFLTEVYQDASPKEDTNHDDITFNDGYGKDYKVWEEVEQFSLSDLEQLQRAAILNNVWKTRAIFNHYEKIASSILKADPDSFICPKVGNELLSHNEGVDLSLIASSNVINCIHGDLYELPINLLASCLIAPFKKHLLDTEIMYIEDEHYEGMRWLMLSTLPYVQGYTFFSYTIAHDKYWGGTFGLVNQWTPFPKDIGEPEQFPIKKRSWKEGGPIKVIEYDSRFNVIPQFSPFVAKVFARHDDEILWVFSTHNEEKPLVLGPMPYYLAMDAHAVTDILLFLRPDKIDLSRYKVVVYWNPQASCLSEKIYQKLLEFVRGGGCVIVNGYPIASRKTILGEENKLSWWKGTCVGREETKTEAAFCYQDTYASQSAWLKDRHSFKGTTDLLRPKFTGHLGAYPFGSEAEFVYKFDLPEGFDTIKIADIHSVWAPEDVVKLWVSTDGENWRLLHNDTERWKHINYEQYLDIEKDLGGKRTIYVKYYLYAGDKNRAEDDNRGACLEEFKLIGLRRDQIQITTGGQTQAEFQGETYSYDGIYPYLLPKGDIETLGIVKDTTGAKYPLLLLRKEGKGKLILVNLPPVFSDVGSFKVEKEDWKRFFTLLQHIVSTTSGKVLPDFFSGPHVYEGEGFAVAWNPPAEKEVSSKITLKVQADKVHIFDCIKKELVGRSYLESTGGEVSFDYSFPATFGCGLWIKVPYDSRPHLLYADGTLKNRAKIKEGKYKDGNFSFEFAECAYLISPERPKMVLHGETEVAFDYDSNTKLLTIHGKGELAEAEVIYQ